MATAATVLAVRRWLTLERLLEVLPLKKSYVYYLAITKQREKGANGGMAVPVSPTNDWCGGRESNPHVPCGTRDFKSPGQRFAPPCTNVPERDDGRMNTGDPVFSP